MPEVEIIKTATVEQLKKTLGDSGTERYSGYFLEEPNAQWRDANRIDNVEEMRRTDGVIKGILNALKAPILSTTWRIEGGKDEHREFVEKCLFGGMQRTWEDFLKESLAYLDFGHYCFEIIYDTVDGRIGVVDLAPRIPKSILRWKLKDGRFGIVQQLRTDEKKDLEMMPEIPAEKLLILTNDKEGDDVTGQSILRSAYKHYKYKDVLYRIQGIASERYGVGVPVIYLPDTIGQKEKDEVEKMLAALRSNEKGFVVIPWKKADGELEILTPKGNPQGQTIDTAIEHHNKQILMSILAMFLGLGTDSTGSFALSKDQSSFFLKHVDEKARYVKEQINIQVIRRMIDLAFGPQKEYPKACYNSLGDIDFKEYSEVLKTLIDSGLVVVDNRMKKFTSSMFELPEITTEDEEKMDQDEMTAELEKAESELGQYDLPDEPIDNNPQPPEKTAPKEEPAPADEE